MPRKVSTARANVRYADGVRRLFLEGKAELSAVFRGVSLIMTLLNAVTLPSDVHHAACNCLRRLSDDAIQCNDDLLLKFIWQGTFHLRGVYAGFSRLHRYFGSKLVTLGLCQNSCFGCTETVTYLLNCISGHCVTITLRSLKIMSFFCNFLQRCLESSSASVPKET
jgi:hypothetical protein